MSKTLKYAIIGFLMFLGFSMVIYFIAEIKSNIEEEEKKVVVEIDEGVSLDVEKVINNGEWHEITEEDKITLALTAETEIVSKLKQYLKDNKIAIFFVYGGPFDYNMEGNYIICTGFNEDGKAKILYPDDNFEKEWKYSFEGLIEFSQKVMLFEM